MKKNHYLASLTCALTLFMITEKANAQSNQTPEQNQQELTERVKASRSNLKVLMDQALAQHPIDMTHSDYMVKIRPFIDSVEAQMDSFDLFVEKQIKDALKEDILYYNSQAHAKDSSADQIAQTLPGLRDRIQAKVDLLKPAYLKEIESLYEIYGDFPNSIEAVNGGFSKLITINGRSIRYQNTTGLDANLDVFQNYVLPMISSGCVSYTCITYTASDYGALLEVLAHKIDQDYHVVLDDQNRTEIVIPALHRNIESAIQIMKTKKYPAWVNALPVMPPPAKP